MPRRRWFGFPILFVLVIGLSLFGVPRAQAQTQATGPSGVLSSPPPTKPSASCPQPNRHQAISALTLQDRLAQGYPLPVNGKTDPTVDQIIHDRGVHFCSDTDTPRSIKESSNSISHTGYHHSIWAGNFADGGQNYTYVQAYWYESCMAWGTNDAFSTWVGLGGIGNSNLVQTGVDGVQSSVLTHYYEAWVQNYGGTLDQNVFGLSCGDELFAQVASGDCMDITDLTSGASSGWRCAYPNANGATAECIIERISYNGSTLAPLSNFNNQTFYHCGVEVNAGPTVGIGAVAHDYYSMYNGSTLLCNPGSIVNTDQYTMYWDHY